ncbi:MAG: carbohydrate porin, partial [Burkholderiales bacterium]|nr:carbohydrate porin [Burkholderiales bacterium]
FDFTDVNRSVASGLAIDGARWKRAGDILGLALVRNALQGPGRAYLAAGGLGLLVGDGRLPRYADERIVEAYYAFQLGPGVSVTADFQRVNNPGYNPERGPVDVYGLRLHAAF